MDSLQPPAPTAKDMARIHAAAFTQSRPWGEDEFADLLDSRFCFAVGDARAFALVRVIADEAELLTIATHPDHQRKGHARRLMDLWQARATARGAREGFLEVAADNAGAHALYLFCGYVQSGLRRGYYGRADEPAVDAIVMKRALP